MDGQSLAQFAGQHYFQHIGQDIQQDAHGENNNALLQGMGGGKGGGIDEPEQYKTGVEGIDQEAGGGRLYIIAFAELDEFVFGVGTEGYLFKEQVINAQPQQETATYHTDGLFVFHQGTDQGGKNIAQHHQQDIAYPYAGHKGKPALVPIGETLFDDGKNNRPD